MLVNKWNLLVVFEFSEEMIPGYWEEDREISGLQE